MNASGLSSRLGALIQLFAAVASFPLLAGDAPPPNLGSGEPGLHIIFKKTNQFVIYQDEPWTVGSFLIGGMDKRQIEIICDRNVRLTASPTQNNFTHTTNKRLSLAKEVLGGVPMVKSGIIGLVKPGFSPQMRTIYWYLMTFTH